MDAEKFIEPNHLLELENSHNDEIVTPAAPELIMSAASRSNNLYHYYVPPFSQHPNGCAQSAMATILTYWNYMNYNAGNAESLYVNEASKPDIAGGLLGTSWERVTKVLNAYGMNAQGQNEPRLTVNSEKGKLETLSNWVNKNFPVAVILGNGELHTGSGAHWGVVVRVTSYDVTLANYGNGFFNAPLADFMKAWQSYWLPGVHYAGVFAQPK